MVNEVSRRYLGVDVGGTKLAAGIVTAAGELLRAERVPTPVTRDAEVLFAALCRLIDKVAGGPPGAVNWAAVGVGCGGPMRYPAGEVSPLNIPAWRDFPLRRRLCERYGCPVVVDNDAKAFALGEYRFGTGRGAGSLLGMVVSTGVGGGLILDGRLVHGGTGNAGHIGHVVVRPNGPRCGCGARGCVEAIASGPSVVRRYRARTSRSGGPPATTGEDVVARAHSGDELARQLVRESAEAVGRAIAITANLFDIDRAVIGGGLSNVGAEYFATVREAAIAWSGFPFARRVEIVPAGLGRESGVIGGAALVLPE